MAKMQELVDGFLAQDTIAVVGVRTTVEDAANGIYKKFKDQNYHVVPINPATDEYLGDPCYPSVKDVPGGVGAAMIVTRPELTEQIVRDCAEAGVKYVWMHRSIGNSVSDEAVAYCREQGIHVIPGGCPMMFVPPVDIFHYCLRGIGKVAGFVPK